MKALMAVFLVFSFALNGCAAVNDSFIHGKSFSPILETPPNYFEYAKDDFDSPASQYRIVLEKEEPRYQIFQVSFASAMSTDPANDSVVFHYIKQKRSGKKPLVIILPIMGGSYFFSEHFAATLADSGFNAIWLERKGKLFQAGVLEKAKTVEELKESLIYTREVYRQTVIDARRVIDWAETRPEIDAGKIGIAGISLGAVMSATVLGVEPRLKAGFLMLGGGDIAYVLTASREKGIKKNREKVLKNLSLSEEELYETAREIFAPVEPLNYAKNVSPERIFMINAYFDRVVPPRSSDLLWKAMNKPERTVLIWGHYTAVLDIGFADNKMIEHFGKRLR